MGDMPLHLTAKPAAPEFPWAQLKDAESLLAYSAEMGIPVDPVVRSTILKARDTSSDTNTADQMLAALATLAQQLQPVTAESLRDCERERSEKKAMRTYKIVAILLAILIVPYSVATFVTSALADAIRKDIVVANALAVRLTEAFKVAEPNPLNPAPPQAQAPAATSIPPTATLTDLQQFAATTRAIDNRALLLSRFVYGEPPDPFKSIRGKPQELKDQFEVPLPLPAEMVEMVAAKLTSYQQVRYFAVAAEEAASVFYGAMASCILPVLYALLGACAFLLRKFERDVKARTYTFNDAHAARFVIAAIGGAVVGLFSNFVLTEKASIPPLAIAFLVGYAVDVFFSFLEGILPKVNGGKSAAPTPSPSPTRR